MYVSIPLTQLVVMMGCSAHILINVYLVCAMLDLPEIVQWQGINVMMGYVMRTQINVFPNPKLMVPPVMMGCIAPCLTSAQAGCAEGQRWIVRQQRTSVMMGYVMMFSISVLPNLKLMVPPVMMGYGVQKMMSALVVCVEGQPETV